MRWTFLTLFVACAAQAREPLREIGLLHDLVDAYARSVDVDDPAVLADAYPGRTLEDFDRDGDGAFGAATDDALEDVALAVLQFNHDDLDADADGLMGQMELDCVVGETRLDPSSAQTFEGVDDADLDCDGDGMANGAELARGLDPLDGRDARACADDASEPNDDAPVVVANDFEADLTLCLDDVDRFAFDVPEGTASLVVAVGFDHALGDLDARLTAPGGDVSESRSVDDDERFEVAEPAVGRWTVEIVGARNDYQLRLTTVPVEGCVPDAREPGAGDDTPERAPVVEAQVIEDQRVCPGDQDWLALDLGLGDGLTVRLEMLGNPTGGDGELDLLVHGPGLPREGGPPPLLPNNAGGEGTPEDPFYLEFRAPRGNPTISTGRYYIQTAGIDVVPLQWGDYRLRVEVDRLRRLCLPDRFEPNEDAAGAASLAVLPGFGRDGAGGLELIPGVGRQIDDVAICARDEDWFELELGAGDDLEVVVTREAPVEGDVRVEIRDAEGRVVGDRRHANAELVATAEGVDAGRHTIRVDGLTSVQTFYSMRVRRTAAPVPCAPDGDEPNDERGAATPVEAGPREGRTLCAADGDVDWYAFDVDELSTVQVELDFAHADGDLELDVFRGDAPEALNAQVRDGHTRSDGESVRLVNQPSGRYFVRVTGFSPDGVGAGNAPYSLSIEVTPRVFACADDPDEPNDVLETATLLGFEPLVRDTQWLCQRIPPESDYFQIDIPPNTPRVVGADFVLFDDGDLFLQVYDLDGMLRASTALLTRNQSKQCVVFPATADPRSYVLRVAPFAINAVIDDDERLDYTLHVLDGEDCEAFGHPSPGIHWPRIR